MGEEELEDPRQGGGGDLELEHVVVPLPLHAAWEVPLEELLHRVQVRKQVVLRGFDLHCDDIAISKFGLEMLNGAHTSKGALYHDGQPGTQRLTFFHAVGCEDHSPPFSDDAHDDIPQHAACLGVHSCGGLVQQHQGRAANERDGCGEFPLVAPTVCASQAVGVDSQTQALNTPVCNLWSTDHTPGTEPGTGEQCEHSHCRCPQTAGR